MILSDDVLKVMVTTFGGIVTALLGVVLARLKTVHTLVNSYATEQKRKLDEVTATNKQLLDVITQLQTRVNGPKKEGVL